MTELGCAPTSTENELLRLAVTIANLDIHDQWLERPNADGTVTRYKWADRREDPRKRIRTVSGRRRSAVTESAS